MPDRRRERAKRIEDLVPVEPGTLGRLALDYLQDLEVRNYSPRYTRSGAASLRYFLVWASDRDLSRPEEVTSAVLERYQRWLYHLETSSGKRLSFRSQNGRLGAVKRFFRWLVKRRVLEWSPAEALELPRVETRLPKAVLSLAEAEKVLALPDVTTPRGLRDRAILEVLLSTGIRRQELVELRLFDLDVSGGAVTIRQGKGKKDRMIPIGERALAWVERYLEEARPCFVVEPDQGALFLTTHCQGLSPEALTKTVRAYVNAAELGKSGSCHLFRHTMATLMLEGGADIRFIQAMLGHADISATQIYTRVAIRKLKEVYERTHPTARLRRERDQAEDGGRETGEPPTREELLSTLAAEAAEEEDSGVEE
jgi:integrase/recombinase XerD